MSPKGKFAFLGEKSKNRTWGSKRTKSTLVFNPYTKKLQRTRPAKKQPTSDQKVKLQLTLGHGFASEDFEPFGHDITKAPQRQNTRFLLYNPNGIPYRDTDFLLQLIRSCMNCKAHYCGFAEINVNSNNYDLSNKMKKAVEEFLPSGLFHMNNTNIHGKSVDYQPGGVAAWFYGRLSRKFKGVQYDKYGRWIEHHFQSSKRGLKVFTLYRVNNSTSKPGSATAWDQQRLVLQSDNINTNPRKQVISDFMAAVQKAIDNDLSVIILSDLNEGIHDREGTNNAFLDMGIHNVLETKYRHLPKTHREGRRAIDHIWGTADVLECVECCGYAPFHQISKSDHRAVFMDINLNRLLPDGEIRLQSAPLRALKSTNPKRVTEYNKVLRKRWDASKVDQRWTRLKAKLNKAGATLDNTLELNKFDKFINDLMLNSEDKAINISSPFHDFWSTKLHNAAKSVLDWGYQVRQALRMNQNNPIDLETLTTCKEGELQAKDELREIRQNSKQYRTTCQGEQASALNIQMQLLGLRGGNYISQIQNTEKSAAQFARINTTLNRKYRKGISCIWIPGPLAYPACERESLNIYDIDRIWNRVQIDDGKDITDWRPIENQFMIEKLLLNWQQRHFRQAGETPLTRKKWLEWLETPKVQEQILDGSFEGDDELPFETSLFLQAMLSSSPTKIDHKISFEEFTEFIGKAKESTSCSPSGRHYGHYKALKIGNMGILHTIFDIFTTALDKGIILERWSQTVTTLLEKKENKPYIHKFRTIHIVEAELQFFTKVIFARRMMNHAEQHGQITDDQYGGRKRRQAASVVLNKAMYYDIGRQALIASAYMDDDAKACYDRIIPQVAEIEAQKWGLTHKASHLATRIIQSQKFFVRTSFGISSNFYRYNAQEPIFGVGQGLGWSGPMWLNTSDTISRIINQRCAGMKFVSFDNNVEVNKKNDMFVDDTASGVTENCITNGKSLTQQLQADEQLHASLLFSAGHRLASQKCSWYLARYKRKGLEYKIIPKNSHDEDVYIKEGFQYQEKKIHRLECNEAHRSLGHWICPSGDGTKQKDEIETKTHDWTSKISTSSLSKDDRKVAYTAFLLPSIRYKLTSTNFSYEECDQLMVRVKEILLNANGMNRNCDRNILFQPHQNMGLGYQHWYHVQGLEKLKLFFLHLRNNDTTGDLIRISTSYTQMEAGQEHCVLSSDYRKWGKYATNTWITHLWQYATECKVALGMDSFWTYKVPRENDVYLLHLIENSSLDTNTKKILNQVRIYLKILTLSDMVIVNKKSTILPDVLSAIKSRDSTYHWPLSEEPPKSWKTIWTSFVKTEVASYLYHRPLGKWTAPTHQEWNTYTNADRNVLVIKGTQYDYNKGNLTERQIRPQLCLFPVDIHKNRMLGFQTSIPQLRYLKKEHKIEDTRSWIERNQGFTISDSEIDKLKTCIKTGNCVGVSDGSLFDHYPAHAWCFANKLNGDIILKSAAPVDGNIKQISSFRAEALGLLAMATLLNQVFKDPQLQSYSVTLHCDGESVIKKLRQPVSTKTKYALDNDIDLIFELQHCLQQNSGRIRVKYVPGHRDKTTDFEELPLLQQLNVLMDHEVRAFIESKNHRPKRFTTFPILSKMLVWMQSDEGLLTHDIEQRLLLNYYNIKWNEYSERKFDFNEDISNMMDHENLGKVLKASQARSQSVKLLHEVQFTAAVRKKWGLSDEANCPLCECKHDSPSHVYACKHKLMLERQRKHRDTLRKFFNKTDTCPKLQELMMLIYGMDEAKTVQDFPNYSKFQDDFKNLVNEQIDIGTHLFKLGIVSQQLGKLYVQRCEWPNKGRDVWTRGLIRHLLAISRDLWNYRCQIQHEENKDTLEGIYREEMWDLCNSLQQDWWRFGPQDRHLLQVDRKFFVKGSSRLVEVWKRQVDVAIASAYYQATKNVPDLRSFFQISKPKTVRHPVPSISSTLIPTQVTYRQMTLRAREESSTALNTSDISRIQVKKKKPITAPITTWLTRKGNRRKISPASKAENNHKTGVQKISCLNQEDIRSCPAVYEVINTRKIKHFK